MYENHYSYVKNKFIKNTAIYLVLVGLCIALLISISNVFAVLILIIICYFYTSSAINYLTYMKWVRSVKKDYDIAVIKFKTQPYLFFKKYHGHKVPLKEYCLPVDMPINVVVLDKLNVIHATAHVDKAGVYDFFISANFEATLIETE